MKRKIRNSRLKQAGWETTPLGEAAIAMHEMFLTITAAGFTKDQAIKLVAELSALGARSVDPETLEGGPACT